MKRLRMVRRSFGVVRGTVAASVPTVLLVLVFVLVSQTARAQSTIFNIPSTDTVDKGKNYVEFDALPQAPGPDGGASTQIFNPRIVIGLPMNAEFGVNVPIYHNSDTNPSSLGYIQPNLKVKYYKNDGMGVVATVGTITNFPVNSTDTQLPWALIYGNFSKKVGKTGPRFTAGPYGVIAKQDDPKKVGFVGTRGGVLLGYEQPITGPLSFVADWYSGKNSVGYFTPGVSIALPHNALINAGYSIGNDSWANSNATKNRYAFFYYGITFP
jgi:hypothetical protein